MPREIWDSSEFARQGIKVLRFANAQIEADLQAVLEQIDCVLIQRLSPDSAPHPRPLSSEYQGEGSEEIAQGDESNEGTRRGQDTEGARRGQDNEGPRRGQDQEGALGAAREKDGPKSSTIFLQETHRETPLPSPRRGEKGRG